MCHHGGVDVIVCVVMMVSRHCLCRHGGFDVIVLVVIPVLQEDSKVERIEMQRQNLSQQLRTMLETNNNSNNIIFITSPSCVRHVVSQIDVCDVISLCTTRAVLI